MDSHVYTKVTFFSKTFLASLEWTLETFADIIVNFSMFVDDVFF